MVTKTDSNEKIHYVLHARLKKYIMLHCDFFFSIIYDKLNILNYKI